jgi:hypothetical protein
MVHLSPSQPSVRYPFPRPTRPAGASFAPAPPTPALLLPLDVQRWLAGALAARVFQRQCRGRTAPRFDGDSAPELPSFNIRPFAHEALSEITQNEQRCLLAIELERGIRALELPLSKRQIWEGQRHEVLVATCYRIGQLYQALRLRLDAEAVMQIVRDEMQKAGT